MLLEDQQRERAKNALRGVYQRLQKPTDSQLVDVNQNNTSNSRLQTSASELDFQAYMDSLDQPAETVQPQNDFDSALKEIEKLGRVKMNNVFDIISQYPAVIQDAAIAVSCLPTTQVSVERLFSQLKLVMRDNRARMGEDLTDAILFLRMNKCV